MSGPEGFMYTVIFMNGRKPEKLGTFGDKGQCRRAWKTCSNGAAIVDAAGAVLEFRSGTTKPAEKALGLLAAEMRARLARGEAVATEAPPPESSRGRVKVERVESVEQVQAMVARDDARAADREAGWSDPAARPAAAEDLRDVNWGAPAGPEDFRGEDYPAEGPQPIVPERVVTAPAPRPAEVTHAVAPATGAVVVGDDTERLAPAAAVTCATKGCDHTPATVRSNTQMVLAPFCAACRVVIRQRGRSFPGGELAVMEHLRAGTLPAVDPQRAAYSARGGKALRSRVAPPPVAAERRPKPALAPKPHREPSPAATLAAGLETARACAEVVARLGGLGPARELAAVVEEHGGAEAVLVTLAAVAELGGMAA